MSKRQKKSKPVAALNQIMRQPDLSVLGNAIKVLPPAQWEDRMLFAGAPDTDLHQYTRQKFPATLRPDMDTHPVFVLQSLPVGHLVCPCSSKGSKQHLRYIPRKTVLEMTGHVLNRDSFLVERYLFTLPLDSRCHCSPKVFSRKLFFKGRVAAGAIFGGKGKR